MNITFENKSCNVIKIKVQKNLLFNYTIYNISLMASLGLTQTKAFLSKA